MPGNRQAIWQGMNLRNPQLNRRRDSAPNLAVFILLLVGCILSAVLYLLAQGSILPFGASNPTLSSADTRATAEAYTFATAEANRQATRESRDATTTALAQASTTAQAESSATALAYARSTATAAVRATAEAPPTLTAIARRHFEDEARAAATVQVLESSATTAFGPSNGTLDHNGNDSAVCSDTGMQVENFIVQARFYNPFPPSQHDWDYGFRFTNLSDHDGSRYDVALDTSEYLSLRLGAPGFYVQDQDTTFEHVDLSENGSNLIKLYVLGDEIHVYINNRYSATLDLRSVSLINSFVSGPRGIAICTGLKEDDLQKGASTRYEDFTIWKLP